MAALRNHRVWPASGTDATGVMSSPAAEAAAARPGSTSPIFMPIKSRVVSPIAELKSKGFDAGLPLVS